MRDRATEQGQEQIKRDLKNSMAEEATPIFSLTAGELLEYLDNLDTFLQNALNRQSNNFSTTTVRQLKSNICTLHDIAELQRTAHNCLWELGKKEVSE
jgi:hypothetical protein